MRKRKRERIRRAEKEREKKRERGRKRKKEREVRKKCALKRQCWKNAERKSQAKAGTWWLMAEEEEENEEECMSTKGHASKRINELIISCGGAARCLEGINAKRHVEQWPECR